jgi:hypothetical protein
MEMQGVLAYLRHLARLPRWRCWLLDVLPGNRFTYPLIEWLEGWQRRFR